MEQAKIGIDIGKGFIKYCYRHKNGGGVDEIKVGEIPSYISTGRLTRVLSSSLDQASAISFRGSHYIIGDEAALGRGFVMRNDERKADERNLIFIISVLARLGISDAHIMVGLPVSQFDKEKDQVKAIFTGNFDAVIGGENGVKKAFNITTNVMNEPLGTYFSRVCDLNGTVRTNDEIYTKDVLIIDIGHSTVDYVVMGKGAKQTQYKGSERFGISWIFDQVLEELRKEYGMLKQNEKVEIINAMIKTPGSQLQVDQKMVNQGIWQKIYGWKRELAKNIFDYVYSSLDVRPPLTMVTGGGGLYLQRELHDMQPALRMHPDARFANAIGFYQGLLYHTT